MTDKAKRVVGGEAGGLMASPETESVGAASLLGVFSSDGGWRAANSLSGIRLWPYSHPIIHGPEDLTP
jgi:hypothetical protein